MLEINYKINLNLASSCKVIKVKRKSVLTKCISYTPYFDRKHLGPKIVYR